MFVMVAATDRSWPFRSTARESVTLPFKAELGHVPPERSTGPLALSEAPGAGWCTAADAGSPAHPPTTTATRKQASDRTTVRRTADQRSKDRPLLTWGPMVGTVVAIDAGTTGIRSLLVDETGRVLRVAYRELSQHFPHPGWVEHDADEIWRHVLDTLGELLHSADAPPLAVGIT